MNEVMTEVFEEQPLASPGSANDILFPLALPSVTPSGEGVYLTVHSSSRPNTDTVYRAIMDPRVHSGMLCKQFHSGVHHTMLL